MKTGYIYFLFKRGELLYIGMTTNLRLIAYFKPKYNKISNPNFKGFATPSLPIRRPMRLRVKHYNLMLSGRYNAIEVSVSDTLTESRHIWEMIDRVCGRQFIRLVKP